MATYTFTFTARLAGAVTFSASETATADELRLAAENAALDAIMLRGGKKVEIGSGTLTAGRQLAGPRQGYRQLRRRRLQKRDR